ncbi:hypothetical protein L195_g002117 [Trifolium pratense]|uniref:Uncharacterized protein n=1 Tax=Trifolium pratense TaxID=57577 RepID=A0A2K3NRK0_TRIPR|nr:hypothetical protein L195_g002117 [Trifolium pratense]
MWRHCPVHHCSASGDADTVTINACTVVVDMAVSSHAVFAGAQ